MKSFTLLLLFCQCCTVLLGQRFGYTLYFEDAKGNRDSVVMGYDEAATYGLDAVFGEIDLKGLPFDSLFEVRAAAYDYDLSHCDNGLDVFYFQSKQFITHFPPNRITFESEAPSVIIKARHFPVKVWWDKSLFLQHLETKSLIVDWRPGGWFDACCCPRLMRTAFYDSLHVLGSYSFLETDVHAIIDDETMRILFFPFVVKRISNVQDFQENVTVKLSPNPVSDLLTFQFSESLAKPATVRLFNQLGEEVLEQPLAKGQREADVPVSHLPKGLYFYSVVSEGIAIGEGKVVVVR